MCEKFGGWEDKNESVLMGVFFSSPDCHYFLLLAHMSVISALHIHPINQRLCIITRFLLNHRL